MYNLILSNASGKSLTFNDLGGQFTIVEITGLNPPKANINTNKVALMAGSRYNSSKILDREVQIAFAVEERAEEGRLAVYEVLQTGNYVKLEYQSDILDVYIEGYVWNIIPTYFAPKQIITVDILFPSPYFKGAQSVVNDLSAIISQFFFPFASEEEGEIVFGYLDSTTSVSIENKGHIECGLVIELYARGSVTNPKIYNYITGDFIGLNISLEAGDLLTITTDAGHKTATLLRDGVHTNQFNSLMEGSKWLQLPAEGGEFVYEIGSGAIADLQISFSHNDLYEGV